MKNKKLLEAAETTSSSNFKQTMVEFAATARGLQLWFHGAHHSSKGTAFIGDHVNLYGELYNKLGGDVDTIMEKAIGISGDDSISCPRILNAGACEILEKYPSPVSLNSLALVSCAKTLVKGYLGYLQYVSDELASTDELSLGLDDFISASANGYETFVYLLGQREKVEMNR
jgi:DNA-binding ferritin-like protein